MSAERVVTVAIPVLNGMPVLAETLQAVREQRFRQPVEIELLVADSGSNDSSRAAAVAAGARVIDVPEGEFSHGGTRNVLAAEARGAHVAFLTQDATPANADWLQCLLDGFDLAPRVGLIFGPYRPRADASPMVRRELDEWFRSFSPDRTARIDSTSSPSAHRADRDRAAFFTDANGCLAREAWADVPFRAVSYAEDQMLAADMRRAGWAKTYAPDAVVLHSHEYRAGERLRRSFDEARALREVHGQRAHGGIRRIALVVQRDVRDDVALLRTEGAPARRRLALIPRSVAHHTARVLGATLGSRAGHLPSRARRLLSLERRDGFDPQC